MFVQTPQLNEEYLHILLMTGVVKRFRGIGDLMSVSIQQLAAGHPLGHRARPSEGSMTGRVTGRRPARYVEGVGIRQVF